MGRKGVVVGARLGAPREEAAEVSEAFFEVLTPHQNAAMPS